MRKMGNKKEKKDWEDHTASQLKGSIDGEPIEGLADRHVALEMGVQGED